MEVIRDKVMPLQPSQTIDNRIASRSKSRADARSKSNEMLVKTIALTSMSILVFILLLNVVMGYTQMVAINSDIRIMHNENESLEKTINNLEIEMAPFITTDRIEKIALNRLGMIYPTEENIVKMQDNNSKANNSNQNNEKVAEKIQN